MPKLIRVENLADLKANCTVDENGCWLWNHSVRGQMGYAQVTDRVSRSPGKQIGGHVFSFYLKHGRFPENLALHTCHVPKCCNPEHIVDANHSTNNSQTWTLGGKKYSKEAYRKRMIEDKNGHYARGRAIGMPRGLAKMNGPKV